MQIKDEELISESIIQSQMLENNEFLDYMFLLQKSV